MTIADAKYREYTFTTTGGVAFTLNTANLFGKLWRSLRGAARSDHERSSPAGYSLIISNIKDLAGTTSTKQRIVKHSNIP